MAKKQPKPASHPVTIMVTLTVQREIVAPSEEEYEEQRDKMVAALEGRGYTVSVESEDES